MAIELGKTTCIRAVKNNAPNPSNHGPTVPKPVEVVQQHMRDAPESPSRASRARDATARRAEASRASYRFVSRPAIETPCVLTQLRELVGIRICDAVSAGMALLVRSPSYELASHGCDWHGCSRATGVTTHTRRDALRLKMARKIIPMAIAIAATTIPPMIEAAAEAPVAKAMMK